MLDQLGGSLANQLFQQLADPAQRGAPSSGTESDRGRPRPGAAAGPDPFNFSPAIRGLLQRPGLIDGLGRAGGLIGDLGGPQARDGFGRAAIGQLAELAGGGPFAAAGASRSSVLSFQDVSISFDKETNELSISIDRASVSSQVSALDFAAPGVRASGFQASASAEQSSFNLTLDLDDGSFEASAQVTRIQVGVRAVGVVIGPGVNLPEGQNPLAGFFGPPPPGSAEGGEAALPSEAGQGEGFDAVLVLKQIRESFEQRQELIFDLLVPVDLSEEEATTETAPAALAGEQDQPGGLEV